MFVVGRAWCGFFCPEGTLTEAASRRGLLDAGVLIAQRAQVLAAMSLAIGGVLAAWSPFVFRGL